MKIAILGPVTTETYYGGVSVFDEEIAMGFQINGWDSVLITNQKNVQHQQINGIRVRVINKVNAKKILNEEQADFILVSLGFAKYLTTYHSNVKTIYFLHGFFNRNYYGKIKSELATLYQKVLIKKCDYVFANSYFTKMINSNFFNIHTDAVFHLGVTSEYYREIQKKNIKKAPRTILYAGKLVATKGAKNVIKALEILQEQGVEYKAVIAGSGQDEETLHDMVKEKNLNVSFTGRINQNQLVDYYSRCEIFISLNPSEPFGIVFPEALLAQCKIVCPYTGGQIEYLNDYRESIVCVDETSPNSIAEGIKKLLDHSQETIFNEEHKKRFSYKFVAKQMIDFLTLEKNIEYNKRRI